MLTQLEWEDTSDLKALELQPINLGFPIFKEIRTNWPADMATYISDNPHVIVNRFIRFGIMGALDGQETDDLVEPEDDQELDSEDDSDESEADFSDSQ